MSIDVTFKSQPVAGQSQPVVLVRFVEHLRHMLGATRDHAKTSHGFRNHFCAEIGFRDHDDMVAMQALGLVTAGRKINNDKDQYFHATLAGCQAIGLSKAAIKRAFED